MNAASGTVEEDTQLQLELQAPGNAIAGLESVLGSLIDEDGDIVAALVTSNDGLPWARVLPDSFDARRFSAMSSSLLALSLAMAREAGRGDARSLFIATEKGNIHVLQAGYTLLLTVFTRAGADLHPAFARIQRAATQIERIKSAFDIASAPR